MSQNITLLGASYSAVPAVNLPKTGGGTATFTDVTDTTAAAGDVATGKYFYTAAGVRTQGTSSGGGGLTSVVRGTFKYTAEGWNTITLPYTGSGFPIAAIIFVKNGKEDSTFSSEIRRYTTVFYSVYKNNCTTAPTYTGTGDNNANYSLITYKNSASDPSTLYSASNSTTSVYNTTESNSNGWGYSFRISGDKQIKVRMVDKTNNTSRYGFLVNTDYEYLVVYSS